MKPIIKSVTALFFPGMLFLGSCVDNNYNLTDIDTTVKVNVDHLTIPVNLDAITLGSIIDLSDSSVIDTTGGVYAINHMGVFTSDAISIQAISLKAPAINPSQTTITLSNPPFAPQAIPSSCSYDLASEGSTFRFSSSFVSDLIVSIDYLKCDLTLTMLFEIPGIDSYVNHITFSDLVLQLPKGLDIISADGGSYNHSTGELTIPSRTVTGSSLSLTVKAKGLYFNECGGQYDYDNNTLTLEGSLYIKHGLASVDAAELKPGITALPSTLSLLTNYTLSDTEITAFSGKVKYSLSGINVTDIDLTSMPDIFSQPLTNLSLVNPCFYLHIDNPLEQFNLYARTGIEIAAIRGADRLIYTPEQPFFTIGPGSDPSAYTFCISPSMTEKIDPEYSAATHVAFPDMGQVLSGDGIPQHLAIAMTEPQIPSQAVDNLPLGRVLGHFTGKYKFHAPLEFAHQSTITYTDTVSGWDSDDMRGITITELEVNVNVTSNIPVGVSFTAHPIDKNGKPIDNVEITGADIDANADNQHVVLRITGSITGLDGIIFRATATAGNSPAPLSPAMSIILTDLRPNVSGYYVKEL